MDKLIAMYDHSKNIKKSEDFLSKIAKAVLNLKNGGNVNGIVYNENTGAHKNMLQKFADGGKIKKLKATERLKDGGPVYEKGYPIGRKLHMEYVVKDVDSVPAILAPNEFVLTPKMVKRVKGVFKKAGEPLIKGM